MVKLTDSRDTSVGVAHERRHRSLYQTVLTETQPVLPQLTVAQQRLKDSKANKRLFLGPYGSGKTYGALDAMIDFCLVVGAPGQAVVVYCPQPAPTMALATVIAQGKQVLKQVRPRVHELELTNDVRFLFRGPAALQYERPAVIGVILDEAQTIPQEVVESVLRSQPKESLVITTVTKPAWMGVPEDEMDIIESTLQDSTDIQQ